MRPSPPWTTTVGPGFSSRVGRRRNGNARSGGARRGRRECLRQSHRLSRTGAPDFPGGASLPLNGHNGQAAGHVFVQLEWIDGADERRVTVDIERNQANVSIVDVGRQCRVGSGAEAEDIGFRGQGLGSRGHRSNQDERHAGQVSGCLPQQRHVKPHIQRPDVQGYWSRDVVIIRRTSPAAPVKMIEVYAIGQVSASARAQVLNIFAQSAAV